MKKIVTIDLDDVTIDFNTAFATWHNKQFGTSVKYPDIHTFNLLQVYDISREEFNHRTWEFLHRHHGTIPLIPGARKGFEILSDHGVKIHIVTSRWDTLEEVTWTYLNQQLPNLVSDVHFANAHHEHHGGKVDICLTLDSIAHVEDAAHHAESVATTGITALLPDRPWNQHVEHPSSDIIRCGNWQKPGSEWQEIIRHVTQRL